MSGWKKYKVTFRDPLCRRYKYEIVIAAKSLADLELQILSLNQAVPYTVKVLGTV